MRRTVPALRPAAGAGSGGPAGAAPGRAGRRGAPRPGAAEVAQGREVGRRRAASGLGQHAPRPRGPATPEATAIADADPERGDLQRRQVDGGGGVGAAVGVADRGALGGAGAGAGGAGQGDQLGVLGGAGRSVVRCSFVVGRSRRRRLDAADQHGARSCCGDRRRPRPRSAGRAPRRAEPGIGTRPRCLAIRPPTLSTSSSSTSTPKSSSRSSIG